MQMEKSDLYKMISDILASDEEISWSRFYNFSMSNSILALAWATMYTSPSKTIATSIALSSMCVIGILIGFFWSDLGRRSRMHHQCHFNQLLELEKDEEIFSNIKLLLRPYSKSSEIRDFANGYSSNPFILKTTPLMFSVLYIVFLVCTWLR